MCSHTFYTPMDDHLQRLSRTLFEFQQTGYLCDTVLTADDGQLKAHSAVLAAASPVFKASLKPDETEQIIVLSGVDLHVLESAIRFAYTGEIVIQERYSSPGDVAFVVETLQQLGLQLPIVGMDDDDNGKDMCTATKSEKEKRGNGKALGTNRRRSKVKHCRSQTSNSGVGEADSGSDTNNKCNAANDINLDAGGINVDAESRSGNSEKKNEIRTEHSKENQSDNCTRTSPDADKNCSKIHNSKSHRGKKRKLDRKIDSKSGRHADGDVENGNESGTANYLRSDSDSCGDTSTASNKKKDKLCEHCGVMRSRQHFSSHMRVHDGNRPHACAVCGLRFSMRTNLMRHMKLHTGQRPYICEFCGRGFIQSNMLTDHKYVHHRETIDLTSGTAPYRCRSCSATFFTTQQLSAHVLRNHRNASERPPRSRSRQERSCERPYACPECESCFRFPSHLYTHLRLHTGELPHACSVCDKAFAQPQSLAAHMLVHADIRAYVCTVCGKRLRQAAHLRQHMYGHTGERPFPCMLCDKSYRYRADLRFHCTRVHQVQLPMKRRVCVSSKAAEPESEPEPDSSRIVISSDTVSAVELCLDDILADC